MYEFDSILRLSIPVIVTREPEPSLPLESDQPPAASDPVQASAIPEESVPPEESEAPGESAAPEESETPEESGAPEESAAPEESEAPEESTAPESADPEESEPVESEAVASPEPAGTEGFSLPLGAWIGLGAALAVAVLAVILLAVRKGKKRKAKSKADQAAPAPAAEIPQTTQAAAFVTEQPERPAPAPAAVPAVRIGKLHQQGARSSQQDCFSVTPEDLMPTHGLLAVVADGMGGLADGDKVSQAAVSAMVNGFFLLQGEPDQVLLTLLEQANNEVNRLLGPEGYSRGGSTLVAGLVRNGFFHYISVGDSRICLYRDGALYQLNREHVFRRELELRAVNQEEALAAAAVHPKAAGLTSYLGMGRLKYVDVPDQPLAIRPGDKFVLMSDGVYNALSQAELTACLAGTPEQAAVELEETIRAKKYSNQDNYTAVILGF